MSAGGSPGASTRAGDETCSCCRWMPGVPATAYSEIHVGETLSTTFATVVASRVGDAKSSMDRSGFHGRGRAAKQTDKLERIRRALFYRPPARSFHAVPGRESRVAALAPFISLACRRCARRASASALRHEALASRTLHAASQTLEPDGRAVLLMPLTRASPARAIHQGSDTDGTGPSDMEEVPHAFAQVPLLSEHDRGRYPDVSDLRVQPAGRATATLRDDRASARRRELAGLYADRALTGRGRAGQQNIVDTPIAASVRWPAPLFPMFMLDNSAPTPPTGKGQPCTREAPAVHGLD